MSEACVLSGVICEMATFCATLAFAGKMDGISKRGTHPFNQVRARTRSVAIGVPPYSPTLQLTLQVAY